MKYLALLFFTISFILFLMCIWDRSGDMTRYYFSSVLFLIPGGVIAFREQFKDD